jgi:hypothetical protein
MDIDMGKAPEPGQLQPVTEPTNISTLEGWIESLMKCKQLSEADVTKLCDRVRYQSISLPLMNDRWKY